jgi:hypothetical protein
MKQYHCWCYDCLKDMNEDGWPITLSRMILCPVCGNKRCPRATNHTNLCTNSNEPGQPGSRYTNNFYIDTDVPDYGALKIKPYETPFVIECKNREGQEIFRLTQEGDIFWKGRKIESDDEIRKATTDFLLTWMNGMNK